MKKFPLLIVLLALAACEPKTSSTTASLPGALPSAGAGDPKQIVAELDGEAITQADLDKVVASQLARVQAEIYEINKRGLDSIIEDRLLEKTAKKRGVSVQELIKLEINEKVGDVTDKEVQDFYTQNKPRFGNKTFEEVKTPLRQQLLARKAAVYRQNFLDRLLDDAEINILLKPPTVDVSVDDDPMLGDKNATVTIIEFTDYQCPFCGRARPTVKEILSKYGSKVRYVLRDYPLDFHPNAQKASEAAQCAGDQGKYWDYSDLLWENQRSLDIADLKKYAVELKLDQVKFDECLDKGKFTEEVQKDFMDGQKAGVTGTPSFFINGIMITGARPVEQFQEIIDAQLRQGKKKS